MSGIWRALGALTVGTARATSALSRAVTGQVESAVANRGRFAARSGVLGPGDPPPPADSGDLYDYRGVVPPRSLRGLQGSFTLGTAVDPRRGTDGPIGIDAATLEQHAAVIGPTGSGKTSSVIVPWIAAALREGHSVVAIDVTGKLLDDITDYVRAIGPLGARVARWDFTRPGQSVSWNWLSDLRTEDAIVSAVEALIGRDRPADPQPYFMQRDKRILRGLIEAVLATGNPSVDVLVAAASDQRLLRRLAALNPTAGQRLAEAASAETGDFGRLMSGVVNALDVFTSSGVRAVTNGGGFSLTAVTTQPMLLIVGAPISGSRTSVAVSSLMIGLLTRELYTRFGARQKQRVFYVIDEAARLTDRIDFEELLSVSRAAGISTVLAAQDVAQFPEAERSTILGNCATYISLPTPSSASASYFASRLGHREISTLGSSRTVGGFLQPSGTQITRGRATVPVLGTREIMDPPWPGRPALVHCRPVTGTPFAVDLTRSDLV